MNLFVVSGFVGSDSELVRLPESGSVVLNWPLAVRTGTKARPSVMWLRCSLWGPRAEGVQPYVLKGRKLVVTGSLSSDPWVNAEGREGVALNLLVSDLTLDRKYFKEPDPELPAVNVSNFGEPSVRGRSS